MSFLKKQIRGQERCSVFFNLIRKTRLQGIEKKRQEYKWEDFKIYPSGLSLTMCPKAYLLNCLEFNGISDINGIYRTSRGKAIHWELQQDLLESDRIWDKPICYDKYTDRLVIKHQENWPEVPFHCLESGVSGSADGVINWNGPVVIEIKSTSQKPENWKTYIEEKLPDPKHILQTGLYMWYFNRFKVFPEDCNRAILAYQNTLIESLSQESEVEFLIKLREPSTKLKYKETLEELVEDLVLNGLIPVRNQLKEQWEDYLQTGELELDCNYSKCFHHGKKTSAST